MTYDDNGQLIRREKFSHIHGANIPHFREVDGKTGYFSAGIYIYGTDRKIHASF